MTLLKILTLRPCRCEDFFEIEERNGDSESGGGKHPEAKTTAEKAATPAPAPTPTPTAFRVDAAEFVPPVHSWNTFQVSLPVLQSVLRISVIYWYGSGSRSADPCLWPMDPDPDHAIFVLDLQDANKKLFFSSVFCLLLFEGTFTSFLSV